MEAALQKGTNRTADIATKAVLNLMAFCFNNFERYRKYLRSNEGWINFSVGLSTENKSVMQSIHFENGKVSVHDGVENVSVELILMDEKVLKLLASLPPNEVLNLLLKSKMTSRGNMAYLEYFNLLISVLLKDKQIKQMHQQTRDAKKSAALPKGETDDAPRRKKEYMRAGEADPGVRYIREDQYLSSYSLEDFPRLAGFVDIHFTQRPAVCVERASILTHWFQKNGFEVQANGQPWNPELRQAFAFKHLMEQRKPIIRKGDLIAGTTTTQEIGVPIYPDTSGTLLWGELLTVSERMLNPYTISDEVAWELNNVVMPFWAERNVREWVRTKYHNPVCQQLDERFAVNFLWKTVAFSHTILDYPKLLRLGARGIIDEIEAELKKDTGASQEKKDTLYAMHLCYEGIITYAKHLSEQAARDAAAEQDAARKAELLHLSEICARVPEHPSETFDEAVNAIWIHWIAVHMENTNAGFSLGRMDQFLQPYFVADMEKLHTPQEREAFVKHAIEMVGCFYMRCTDHLHTIPDIGNYLFGGS